MMMGWMMTGWMGEGSKSVRDDWYQLWVVLQGFMQEKKTRYQPTDRRTDRPTNGWTDPLIEFFLLCRLKVMKRHFSLQEDVPWMVGDIRRGPARGPLE